MPLLTKDTIRARLDDMTWRDEGKRLSLVHTSGSTNEALAFYTNSNREAQINAARMRGHEWIGVRRGEKEMYFWGSPIELSQAGPRQARPRLADQRRADQRLRDSPGIRAGELRVLEAMAAAVPVRLSVQLLADGHVRPPAGNRPDRARQPRPEGHLHHLRTADRRGPQADLRRLRRAGLRFLRPARGRADRPRVRTRHDAQHGRATDPGDHRPRDARTDRRRGRAGA